MRITFLNQKGGVGKTTVALLLAATLQKAGYDIAIDDQDPQASSKFFCAAFGLPLFRDNQQAKYIVTDTPGHLQLEGQVLDKISAIIAASEKLILVTEKSPAAIHSSMAMACLIRAHMPTAANAFVLFNKVRANTTIGKQEAQPIADDFGLPPLRNELPLSSVYESALLTGLSGVTGERRTKLLNIALEIMQ